MFQSQGSQFILLAVIIVAILVGGYFFKKWTGIDPGRDAQGRRYNQLNHRYKDNPTAQIFDILKRLASRNSRR